VTVEIWDRGPSPAVGQMRYHVEAETEDGKSVICNLVESLDVALAIVRWWNLDS
jgi:hypothetical protein